MGIEEPRLKGLAADLAATGYPVMTLALPDLFHYRITPAATDVLEDAVSWMAAQPRWRGRARRHGRGELRRRPVDGRGRPPGIRTRWRSCCRLAATATCRVKALPGDRRGAPGARRGGASRRTITAWR